MKNTSVLFLAQASMIAAIYVVLTVIFAPLSFGEIQVRFSEALTILPLFTPAAIPGLFVGCLLGNILGGAALPDILLGSLATLLGAVGTYLIGKHILRKDVQAAYSVADETMTKKEGLRPLLGAVPPIVANALIVPFVLRYAYGILLPIPLMMLTVGIGEILSCGVLGFLLYKVLHRRAATIFPA